MRPSTVSLTHEELAILRKVLRKIDRERYLDWVLTKSQTRSQNGRLVSLDLSWHGIREMPSGCLTELKYLRELRFDNNPNCDFEDSALYSKSLTAVRFQFCDLSTIPNHAFPRDNFVRTIDFQHNPVNTLQGNVLSNLNDLEMINLSHCGLDSLHKEAFNGLYKLKSLILNHNTLTSLDNNGFQGLYSLRNLEIMHNSINKISSSAFIDLDNLQTLKLSHNHLDQLPDDVFIGSTMLQTIALDNNRLNQIGRQFYTLKSLVNLNLEMNFIHTIATDALKHANNLASLDLETNQIADFDHDLFSECRNLEYLDMRNNPLGIDAALALPEIARFDFTDVISSIDPESLHSFILTHPENMNFITQAKYSGKLLEKTWAFLRLIGKD